MALIMKDLEMNVALSTSEMADVNGGSYDKYGKYGYKWHNYPRIGVASADATAGAFGVHEANTLTDTYAEVGRHYAVATSLSSSYAS